MPHWLAITLAVFLWLYALSQVRMYFIYTGRIHSPAIGLIQGNPTLRAVAIRSVVTSAIYGFVVLFVRWPQLLTYLSIVWSCREIVDDVLGWCGRGTHGVQWMVINEKGRRHVVIVDCFGIGVNLILVVVFVHFFGF